MKPGMKCSVSRRRFLSSAGAIGAVAALRAGVVWAEELDPRVAGIVSRTVGIDTHNHVDVPLAAGDGQVADLDFTGEMKRSGLSAICATFATDYRPGDAYERYKTGVAVLDVQLKREGLKRALSAADVRVAHGAGKPAVVQALEGGHFLEGHIERVEEAYDRGLRVLGLLHDSDASVPLGDVYTRPPKFGGLTAFGMQVVKACSGLGMLMDLTHADMPTTAAAIKASSKPIVYTHTGLDTRLGNDPKMAQMMRPRLISKEHAKLVADAGGVVGVWIHLSDTPLEYAQNIRAMVDVAGVDHVCLGTDTKLTTPLGRPRSGGPLQQPRTGERTNGAWAGETAGFYYVVVDALLKTGFTPEEIAKIGGGNFLRVFGEAR